MIIHILVYSGHKGDPANVQGNQYTETYHTDVYIAIFVLLIYTGQVGSTELEEQIVIQRSSKLIPVSGGAIMPGARVLVRAQLNRPEFNGRIGIVERQSLFAGVPGNRAWIVVLDRGEVMLLFPFEMELLDSQ